MAWCRLLQLLGTRQVLVMHASIFVCFIAAKMYFVIYFHCARSRTDQLLPPWSGGTWSVQRVHLTVASQQTAMRARMSFCYHTYLT